MTKDHNLRLNPTSDQKVEEKDPHFFKWGSVFFNFLILGTVLSHIMICCRATIACVNFSRFWPLKIKIFDKKLQGHNPCKILNHIIF